MLRTKIAYFFYSTMKRSDNPVYSGFASLTKKRSSKFIFFVKVTFDWIQDTEF